VGRAGSGVDEYAVPTAAARRYVARLIADCRLLQRPIVLDTQILIGYIDDREPDVAIVATARIANAVGLIGKDRRWRAKPLGVPYHYLDDIIALG
jgi:hypothetical protein